MTLVSLNIFSKRLYASVLTGFSIALLCIHMPKVMAQTDELAGVTIDSSVVLGEIRQSRQLYKERDPAQREYIHAQRAVDYALVLNDSFWYARALDNLGLLYRYHQQYAQAINLHTKAFELVEHADIPPVFKMIFANNAGVAARYFEKYDLSVLYYLKALRIAEKENDLKNIAIACNGLGNALGNMPERQEEALAFLNRALEVETMRSNTLGMAMNYLSIADYYIHKEQYNTARSYLNKLKKVNQARNDDHGLAITDEFYGLSYLKEGKDYQRASHYFRLALDRFKKISDKIKEAEILASLGKVNQKLGREQEAREYYYQSMALARESNSKSLIMANAHTLAGMYEKGRNLEKALEYYKLAQLYKDSIDLHEQQVQIAALTTSYDIEKKEARIELLENEKQLRKEQVLAQEEKIRRQQIMFLLIGVLVIAVLIIVLIQHEANKNRKKAAVLLAREEKQRLQAVYERDLAHARMLVSRLQINPHFLFNCLNAINFMIQKGENKKANKYLIVFSRFVRLVLESSDREVVPLTEELALIRHYLILEQNRFHDNFSFNISVSDEDRAAAVDIPPLLLQPFVENAVIHGLLPSKKSEKRLDIEVTFTKGCARVIIADNGVGFGTKALASGHKSMGTRITRDRIELFNKNYKNHIEVDTITSPATDANDGGTQVIIDIFHRGQADTAVLKKSVNS